MALIKDLRRQPVWLPVVYIGLGITASIVGFISHDTFFLTDFLLFAGGGLLALGCEKHVTRSIRKTALELYKKQKHT
ncbi:hypothetical protein CS022_03645 [Veronia nyctiphanis]|uniref:Uncharacterized protein n=1 Tax=Veronia nyctiphanis TaxID=1278244 RepID=A0A4Q0YTS4_9GAMM|nr:hypothetical protein [Veronia nyctiphanis]RXJ74657.1 hypothetical protein CS022_03645 [Veronia nyctiphanis]